MTNNFDTWLTREPAWRTGHGWWETEEWNLTDDNGAAMYVNEISCDDCGRIVGWDDTGFTAYMTDATDRHSKCLVCFDKWETQGE